MAGDVLVGYGEYGCRVGEYHHRSTISDSMVERIRNMREFEHMTYPQISSITGVGMRSVTMIATYKRRASRVVRYRKVAPVG